MNSRNSLPFMIVAVLAIVSLAAAAEKVIIAPEMSITVPETWKAHHDTRSTYTLEHRNQSNKVDATMVVHVEKRLSHAETLQRLATLRSLNPEVSTFGLAAGWPALESKVLAPFQRPGEPQKNEEENEEQRPLNGSEKSLQVITAVAVNGYLIRFETLLQPSANPKLADEALAIARTLTAPQTDRNQSERELRELQSAPTKPAGSTPRAYAPASARLSAQSQERRRRPHPPSGGGGAINVRGAGEIEATSSIDGQNFVTDAACGISYSTTAGASFANSNVNGAGVPSGLDGDCTVAWGQSGNFYLGQLGSSFVALYRSVAPDDGAHFNYVTLAVNRLPASSFPTNVDQPHVAADRWNPSASSQDLVYVSWQETGSFVSRVACSSDSGSTWGAPVDASSGSFGYPRVSVGRDGMVYVVSRSWPNEIILDKFSNCDSGLVEQAGFPVTRTFSDAYGSTCAGGAIPGLDRCNNGNTLASPTVIVDDIDYQWVSGAAQYNHVYMAWAEMNSSSTGQDIMVSDSPDGGQTWSTPVAANSSVTAVRFMPWLGTWGGVAYLGWYDRRFAGSTLADPDDFTRYYYGSVSSANGVLTPGPESDLMGIDDPQCASGWACGTREPQDATSCTVQPQLAGFCSSTSARCDFIHPCSGTQTCNTSSGCPKYGDYNGLATGGGELLNIWASGTAPSDLPPTGNNSILAYVVVTDLPADFFVRDWTDSSSDHDNGEEPSSNPVFFETSDVWNQTSPTAEPFVNDWVVGDSPVRSGSNFAFARVSRRAPVAAATPSITVTADFLMADFGLGVPYIDLGTQTVTLAATDNAIVTPGLAWSVPSASSTHVCIAVQISAPGDPYLPPSLLGGSPGPSGTDPLVLEDNKKAQRNLTVTMGGGAGGEMWAIIHNTGRTVRDMEIEYSVDPQSERFVSGGSITIVANGVAGPPREFVNHGRFTLEHMAPNEDRWIGVKFGRISAGDGIPVVFRFSEVSSGRTVNGFAIAYQREPLPVVARALLQREADVFDRFSAITHHEGARREAEEARQLVMENHAEVAPEHYMDFLRRHNELVRDVLRENFKNKGEDPFALNAALEAFARGAHSGDAAAAMAAHSALLESFDAQMTWSRRRQ